MNNETIEIGFPMEYVNEDGTIDNVVLLRPNEIKALEYKLQELERYKNIIDELILTGLASSITKEDFEYMWKVAYNKEYNPNDIKEIAERHGILKGE